MAAGVYGRPAQYFVSFYNYQPKEWGYFMQKYLVFAALAFMVAGAPRAFAQQMFNSCAENEGADIPVTLPSAFNTANSKLPDPFKTLGGSRMSTKDDWKARRQETLRLLERTVYGAKPPKPSSVTGTVTSSAITVNVSEGGRSASFSVTVSLPTAGTAPYPAVIRYDNSGADAAVLRNNGVAVINYTTSNVGGGTRNAKTGAFYTVNNTHSRTGHLAAWAWGVSRIIDVIEQSDGSVLRADAIGVTGCSRSGKGAFAAGVLDQRVALTMPMESGTGGTNIMRGAFADRATSGTNGAQSPQSAYDEQPWLGDDFSAFASNPNNLPIDMHQAIALVAPRGFLVLDKTASSAGQWLNIPSSHASALAAAEVYKALGAGGNIHYINTPTTSHCAWQDTYNTHMQDFIQKFLHRTKPVGADPIFTATTPPSMTAWIDWTTPALSGELTTGGCGPAPSGFALTVSSSPSAGGKVERSPAPPASGRYDEGATVTVTAVPNDGWRFDGWSGDATGTSVSTTVKMDAGKSVTAKFVPTADGAENLVKDGNFPGTSLTANWSLNQGQYYGNSAATSSVSGGKVTISVTTSGAQPYQPQLIQQGIALDQGMRYRLTFAASAAGARGMNVMIQQSSDPYAAYGEGDFALTAAEQAFALEFDMTAPSDQNAQLSFNVGGGETQSVTISNVKLIYIASGGGITSSIRDNKTVSAARINTAGGLRASVSKSALSVNFSAKSSGGAVLRLYSLKGDVLSSANIKTIAGMDYSHTFDVKNLPNGFYIVGLYDSNGGRERARVVIPK
jgi:uncharacterized repeat protein (TIGR02543 family)